MSKDIFTPAERKILGLYRDPSLAGICRATRLSVQYLIGAGVFTYLALTYRPWFAIFAYFIFVIFAVLRLIMAHRLAGVMPEILAKYEARIVELEAGAKPPVSPDHASN